MPTQMFLSGVRIGGSSSTSLIWKIGRAARGGARFAERTGAKDVEQAWIFRQLAAEIDDAVAVGHRAVADAAVRL